MQSEALPQTKNGLSLPQRVMTRLSDVVWWIISVGSLIALWEIGVLMGWVNSYYFPPPHVFLQTLFQPMEFQPFGTGMGSEFYDLTGTWWFLPKTVLFTFLRVAGGLVAGFLAGAVTGFLIHYVRWFGYLSVPILRLMASISAVAWLPLIINLVKNGNTTAWVLVALSVLFVVALSVSEVIKEIPPTYINAARVMGASRNRIFSLVILPYSLPKLYSMMRINFFAAWMTVLLAETFDIKWGLGVLITLSRALLNANLAWTSLVVIGVVGYFVDLLLRVIENRLFWYQSATVVGQG